MLPRKSKTEAEVVLSLIFVALILAIINWGLKDEARRNNPPVTLSIVSDRTH